ncbi:MAG: AAA family ATPase [Desulfobacterales bacterium]
MYKRNIYKALMTRLAEPRRFVQVLSGPRQTGKTTLARQAMAGIKIASHYATADEPALKDRTWIEQQWEVARVKTKSGARKKKVLLILDEIQKITGWSETVKRLWDEDTANQLPLHVIILGSSAETTISRDILLMTRVDKPALLRRLFQLGCNYSGQILSYQKMLGQLQDAGNTTTLAHYLDLLQSAGLMTGLSKYAGQRVRQRASSPKLLVLNTALMSASGPDKLGEAKQDPDYWGRLVESAIGSSLANGIIGKNMELFYWSSRNREVDFVLSRKNELIAIEVKSGRNKGSLPGIAAFSEEFKVKRKLLVGFKGISLDEILLIPPEELF